MNARVRRKDSVRMRRAGTASPAQAGPVADHVLRLQRQAGNASVAQLLVQRFDAGEHKGIGDAATGQQTIYLAPDLPVTYGEVVALGGDLFDDWPTLYKLAGKEGISKGTKGEVWYAVLVRVRAGAEGRKQKDVEAEHMGKLFDASAKERVNERYRDLAPDNISHFPSPRKRDMKRTQAEKDSGPGATGAGATYRENHVTALNLAAQQGHTRERRYRSLNDPLMIEAFGDHYLTDSFSAGHQMTPRVEAKAYWDAKVPDFWENFQIWLATRLTEEIQGNARTRQLPPYVPNRWIRDLVTLPRLRKKISKVPRIGFGDVVSGAVHDYFNVHGAEADVNGQRISLVGDGSLLTEAHPSSSIFDDRLRHVTEQSQATFNAAMLAVKAGVAEVHQAYELGHKGEDPERVAEMILSQGGGSFAAEKLMPQVAPDATVQDPTHKSIDWQLPNWSDVLDDPRLAEGLMYSMEKYSGQVTGALGDLGADQLNALYKIVVNPMLGGQASVVALFREVLSFTPSGIGAGRHVLPRNKTRADLNDLRTGGAR